MENKEVEMLKGQVKELQEGYEYYKKECESFWAELVKRQNYNLKIARKIVDTNPKAVANIILNMYFGKMPSDSVNFCKIFGLEKEMGCKDGMRCTDCIDNFLKEYYRKRLECDAELESEKDADGVRRG